jgi:hypothetical protein
VRELKEVELVEASLVALAMNPKARIGAVKASPRAFETKLRTDLGLSAREARRLMAGGWSAYRKQSPQQRAAAEFLSELADALEQKYGT